MTLSRLKIIPKSYEGVSALKLNRLVFEKNEQTNELEISGIAVIQKDFGPKPELIFQAADKEIKGEFIKSPFFRKKYEGRGNSGFARVKPATIPEGTAEIAVKVRRDHTKEFTEIATLIDNKYAKLSEPLKNLHSEIFQQSLLEKGQARSFFRMWKRLPDDALNFPEYYEAEAVIRIVLRARLSRSLSVINFVQKFREECDEHEKFVNFERNLLRLTGGYRPTNHGFSKGFSDSRTPEEIWGHLENILEKLEKLDRPIFINSGTLLGYVRNGQPIPHDDDIDLAILLKANNIKDAAKEFIALFNELKEFGVINEESTKRTAPNSIYKLTSLDNFEIDLFPAWLEDGRVFVWPHTFGELSSEDLLPLKETELSRLLLIPNQPEKMLEINYGEDWQFENPYWRFRWGDAKKKFSSLLEITKNHFEKT